MKAKNSGTLKKPKKYPHFDFPMKSIAEIQKLEGEFLSKESVKSYSFYPFLAFLKKEVRFKRQKDTVTKKITLKFDKRKVRPLLYASHKDSLLYSWYAFVLASLYEKVLADSGLGDIVAAYRKDRTSKRSNITTAYDFFSEIKKREEDGCSVLLFDVEKFYDTLDPDILKECWLNTLNANTEEKLAELPLDHYNVYKSIVKYGVVNKALLNEFLHKKY